MTSFPQPQHESSQQRLSVTALNKLSPQRCALRAFSSGASERRRLVTSVRDSGQNLLLIGLSRSIASAYNVYFLPAVKFVCKG